ncbi:hypothetical protein EV182_003272 [Spiromyces aspiralis]|uniref:Uncharacterized protein n=1 Tax=Spiromyces aspiralis TaxID=68401 RepID=A0ACC1HH57_9FUNG|nr:hypothetical protein EV182_003272 [Spiromyces aspiralis]
MEPGVYDFIIDQSFDSTLGMFSVDRFITQHIDVPLGKLRDSGAVRPGGAVVRDRPQPASAYQLGRQQRHRALLEQFQQQRYQVQRQYQQ